MNTLHNISTIEDAVVAMNAIWRFRQHEDWPQHTIHGKKNGGAATFGETTVWVWQTFGGNWHGEIMSND